MAKMKYLLALFVVLTLITPSLAYSPDGVETDWCIDLTDDWSDENAWVPCDGVAYFVEDNIDSNKMAYAEPAYATGVHIRGTAPLKSDYNEPLLWYAPASVWVAQPYGGEVWDIEALFLDEDSGNTYVGIVTSTPPSRIGDLGINTDSDDELECGVKLNGVSTGVHSFELYCGLTSSDWVASVHFPNTPMKFSGGTKVSDINGAFVDQGISDHGVTTYLIELEIPVDDIGGEPSINDLHVTPTCGNDPIPAPELVIAVLALAIISPAFIYLYLRKKDKRDYSLLLIPLLIGVTAIFIFYSDQSADINERDFNILATVSASFLLFYSLSFHKIMRLSTALVGAIFISTLITHVAPAISVQGIEWSGKYLSALDPYYYFRHADTIVESGYVPEKETLVYPTDRPSFADNNFMVSVLMASIALILKPLGISTMDVAMVYAGVFAAFSSIVLYLLIRDLFSEYEPYNKAAALFAAFMLIFNPAFAAKAIASNSEDDALGLFLLIASYFLFTLAYRKKSFKLSVISGFSFLLLNMSWSGYRFSFLVLCVFGLGYPLINALQDLYLYVFQNRKKINRSYIEHIPYLVVPAVMANLVFLIIHAQGSIPVFDLNSIAKYNQIAFGAAIFGSFLLELIRVHLAGRVIKKGNDYDSLIHNFLQKNIYLISGTIVAGGLIFFVLFVSFI